ncbi:MAG: hypothetical protein AAFV43_06880 [Planctomycetota bacterium]
MTPFRVRCETCQTALKVRDEGFIGEVHACPKCGSMVHIIAPAASVKSAAPPSEGATAPAVVLGSTLESDTLDSDTLDASFAAGPRQAAGPEPAESLDAVAPEAVAPLPTPTPTPTPTKLGWLPIALGGVAMFATGIGLAAWFSTAAEQPLPADDEQLIEIDPTPVAPPTPLVQQPDEPAPDEPAADAVAGIEPTAIEELDTPPKREDTLGQADQQTIVTPIDTKPTPPTPDAVVTESPPEAPATAPQPTDLAIAAPPEFDPLDYDPATIELILKRGASPAAAVDTAPTDEDRVAIPTPTPQLELDNRLAAAAANEAVRVERGPSSDPRNAPPSMPAATLLAVTVPRIDLKDVPIAEAIGFFSQLSGAPITLSPAAFSRAGVDARASLSFAGEDQTIGEVLAEGLAQRRLEIETRGAHAVVRRAGAGESRTATHAFDDLAGDNPEALVELLRRCGAPGLGRASVDAAGGVRLDAPRGVHFDLLVLGERLRVARGFAQRTKYPRSMLAREPAMAGLGPTLSRRATFSFVEPTPVREVIAHIERVTRWTVLVDWASLADDAGLGPQSTLTAATINRPWAEALDGLLTPLGLAWAPIDGRTIEVTSRESLAADPPTDFYPATSLQADGALDLINARTAETRSPGADAVYDEASRRLIVRGDAATHRRIWRLLNETAR